MSDERETKVHRRHYVLGYEVLSFIPNTGYPP
jgi:hypothetical protein